MEEQGVHQVTIILHTSVVISALGAIGEDTRPRYGESVVRDLQRTTNTTTDHEHYNGPQTQQRTTNPTTDHRPYNGPRTLQRTTNPTTDHRPYNGPQTLQQTTNTTTDHKVYNGPQILQLNEEIAQ